MGMVQRWGAQADAWVQRKRLVRSIFGTAWLDGPDKVLLGAGLLLMIGGALGWLNRATIGAAVGAASGLGLGALLGGVWARAVAPKAGKLTVAIELAQSEAQFTAGEAVDGYVRVSTDGRVNVRTGRIYLSCRGVYIHDRPASEPAGARSLVRRTKDYAIQEARVAPAGTLQRGASARYPFHFQLPRQVLPTCQGYGCSIEWALVASVELEDGAPQQARQELVVSALPPASQPLPEGYQAIRTTELCQLAMVVDRRIVSEGETLSGHVRISPHQSFDATEVRVLLLRIERNPAGDGRVVYISSWDAQSGQFEAESRPGSEGVTYVWLEDEDNISGAVRLEMAESKAFPFTLTVPHNWRPTFATAEGQVSWQVVGIVSRPGEEDVRVPQDIVVHTGAPQLARVLAPGKAG